MIIQWLEFGPIVMYDLLNISNGLDDHDLWSQNLLKNAKNQTACGHFLNPVNHAWCINNQKRFSTFLKFHLQLEADVQTQPFLAFQRRSTVRIVIMGPIMFKHLNQFAHFFCKHIDIHDRSTAEIWTSDHVQPSSYFQWFDHFLGFQILKRKKEEENDHAKMTVSCTPLSA